MGYTQQTLDCLPVDCRNQIELFKERYNDPRFPKERREREVRLASGSYCLALWQVGLITYTQKRLLHTYITL